MYYTLQVDFEFLKQKFETLKDAQKWRDIVISSGARMVTIWQNVNPSNQAAVLVETKHQKVVSFS